MVLEDLPTMFQKWSGDRPPMTEARPIAGFHELRPFDKLELHQAPTGVSLVANFVFSL
jgi:hypothetical protein